MEWSGKDNMTRALLDFLSEHNIRRNANLIVVTARAPKSASEKVVRVFHSGTTEESEKQLQTFLDTLLTDNEKKG